MYGDGDYPVLITGYITLIELKCNNRSVLWQSPWQLLEREYLRKVFLQRIGPTTDKGINVSPVSVKPYGSQPCSRQNPIGVGASLLNLG